MTAQGDPILYYTRLFMVLLLVGVFSFFGLHTRAVADALAEGSA